jgi:hypothetical protein
MAMTMVDSFAGVIKLGVFSAASEGRQVSAQDALLIKSVLSAAPAIEIDLIETVLRSTQFAANPAGVTRTLVGAIPGLICSLLDPHTYTCDRSLYEHAISMLTNVPESHRTEVFETIVDACNASYRKRDPGIVAISRAVVNSVGVAWNQIALICNAALDSKKNTEPLSALIGSFPGDSIHTDSVVSALMARCTETPLPVGFNRTVGVIVHAEPLFVEAVSMRLLREDSVDSIGSSAVQTLLYAIVAHKPARSTRLLAFLIQNSRARVLEQVLSHGIDDEGQMSVAISTACATLNSEALCILARTNTEVFTKCAADQYLSHKFLSLGGEIRLLPIISGVYGPNLPRVLLGQPDAAGMPLLDTAMRCENWDSVTFVCKFGGTQGAFDSMRRRRPLAKASITTEAARALIDLLASVVFRDSFTTDICAIGLRAFVLRNHDAPAALDLLRHAASKLADSGLADHTGLADRTGLAGSGLPDSGLADIVIAGTFVEAAVKEQLFELASQLVDMVAAEGLVSRIGGKYEIFAIAPKSLYTKVYNSIQTEGAQSLAYARKLLEDLSRVVETTRSAQDQTALERSIAAAHQSAAAQVEQLESSMSIKPVIEKLAETIAGSLRRFDKQPTISRLVDLLYLSGNPAASIARVYADTNSSFFVTAFTDYRIWKYAVAARLYKDSALSNGLDGLTGLTESLFAQWSRYRQHVYDAHESPVASAAMFEDEPVSRTALTDPARAIPALHHIAQFIISNDYPHPQFLIGMLGSEAPSAYGTEGTALVERDTSTGQGAQSDIAFTLFRTCTRATTVTGVGEFTATALALFDPYATGLVPRPDADKDILRLFGWALGFMFTHNVPTGTPCLAPAIFAMLLGITVPNFTDALSGLKCYSEDGSEIDRASVLKLPPDLSCDVEMALTFIGPTAAYGTSEQIAAISAQFKDLTGSDLVTVETFNVLVRITQPLFLDLLGDAIGAIATGLRASITGSSTSVPAVKESNVIMSCAAIFGTPCAVANESDLARIGAFLAGPCFIDVNEIRSRTKYTGFTADNSNELTDNSDHPAVLVLWTALKLLSPADLEDFYIFWTSAPPPRAASVTEYRIKGKADASRTLISSRTCFREITISTALDSVEAALACIKSTIEHDRLSRSMHH